MDETYSAITGREATIDSGASCPSLDARRHRLRRLASAATHDRSELTWTFAPGFGPRYFTSIDLEVLLWHWSSCQIEYFVPVPEHAAHRPQHRNFPSAVREFLARVTARGPKAKEEPIRQSHGRRDLGRLEFPKSATPGILRAVSDRPNRSLTKK